MALSSIDIRRQEFTKRMMAFGAYPPREIHEYLETLAKEVDIYNEKLRGAYEQIQRLKGDLEHYQKVEEALQEALETARENARKTQQNAEQKAALILRDAESRSARTIEEASLQAQKIVHEAEIIKAKARQEVAQLNERRNELTLRLKGFLQAETELLGRIEKDYFNFLTSNDGILQSLSQPSLAQNEPTINPLDSSSESLPFENTLRENAVLPDLPQDLPASAPDLPTEKAAIAFEDSPYDLQEHEASTSHNVEQEEILAALEHRQKALEEELRKLMEPTAQLEESESFDYQPILTPTPAPPPIPGTAGVEPHLAPAIAEETNPQTDRSGQIPEIPNISPSLTEIILDTPIMATGTNGEQTMVAEIWEAKAEPEISVPTSEPQPIASIPEPLPTKTAIGALPQPPVSELMSFSKQSSPTPETDPIPVVRLEFGQNAHPQSPSVHQFRPEPEVASAPLPPISSNIQPEFIQMQPAGIPRELLTASLTEAEKIQRILDELQ